MEAVTEQSAYEQEPNRRTGGKPTSSKVHSYVQMNLGLERKLRYKDRFTFLSELSLDLDGWWSVPDLSIYPKLDIDVRQDEVHMTTPPFCGRFTCSVPSITSKRSRIPIRCRTRR